MKLLWRQRVPLKSQEIYAWPFTSKDSMPHPHPGPKIYRHPDFYIRILSQRDPLKIAAIIPIPINYSNIFSFLYFSRLLHISVLLTILEQSAVQLNYRFSYQLPSPYSSVPILLYASRRTVLWYIILIFCFSFVIHANKKCKRVKIIYWVISFWRHNSKSHVLWSVFHTVVCCSHRYPLESQQMTYGALIFVRLMGFLSRRNAVYSGITVLQTFQRDLLHSSSRRMVTE